LPTKKVVEKASEFADTKIKERKPAKSHLRAESPPVLPPIAPPRPKAEILPEPKSSFVEPEVIQNREQKLKLEKLLQSARTQLLVEAPVEVAVEVQTKTAFVENPEEIQEWDVEVAEVVAVPELDVQVSTVEETQVGHFQLEGVEWQENGRPQWAQSRFDVLLFQVSGLTLAVPLISLGQIQPLTDELTPLFGQADWFMGLQPTAAGKIRTVNTAKFVMPERYDESFTQTAKYVVSINGVPWGLAVDSVNQPITLEPEDVKWRGDRSKRPWLAGTVKDHMCALLDIPRIGQMLIDADKNFVPA
jgi:purine-binding chemotaxis protein CheW